MSSRRDVVAQSVIMKWSKRGSKTFWKRIVASIEVYIACEDEIVAGRGIVKYFNWKKHDPRSQGTGQRKRIRKLSSILDIEEIKDQDLNLTKKQRKGTSAQSIYQISFLSSEKWLLALEPNQASDEWLAALRDAIAVEKSTMASCSQTCHPSVARQILTESDKDATSSLTRESHQSSMRDLDETTEVMTQKPTRVVVQYRKAIETAFRSQSLDDSESMMDAVLSLENVYQDFIQSAVSLSRSVVEGWDKPHEIGIVDKNTSKQQDSIPDLIHEDMHLSLISRSKCGATEWKRWNLRLQGQSALQDTGLFMLTKQKGSGEAWASILPSCIVDYLGFRIHVRTSDIFAEQISLSHGLASQHNNVEGPSKSKNSVFLVDSSLRETFSSIANHLNLMHRSIPGPYLSDLQETTSENCENNRLHLSMGVRSYKERQSTGNRWVTLDNDGTVMPPDLPKRGTNEIVTKRLRSNFVKGWSKPLCPNAYSPTLSAEEAKLVNKEAADASLFLHTSHIPSFTSRLDDLETVAYTGYEICKAMHKEGINIRSLGEIATLTEKEHIRAICETEMVARVCKDVLHKQLSQHILSGQQKQVSRGETAEAGEALISSAKCCVGEFVSLVFSSNSDSEILWSGLIFPGMFSKFGYSYVKCLGRDEMLMFRSKMQTLQLFYAMSRSCSFQYIGNYEELLRPSKASPREVRIVLDASSITLYPKIKRCKVRDGLEVYRLAHEAKSNAQDGNTRSALLGYATLCRIEEHLIERGPSNVNAARRLGHICCDVAELLVSSEVADLHNSSESQIQQALHCLGTAKSRAERCLQLCAKLSPLRSTSSVLAARATIIIIKCMCKGCDANEFSDIWITRIEKMLSTALTAIRRHVGSYNPLVFRANAAVGEALYQAAKSSLSSEKHKMMFNRILQLSGILMTRAISLCKKVMGDEHSVLIHYSEIHASICLAYGDVTRSITVQNRVLELKLKAPACKKAIQSLALARTYFNLAHALTMKPGSENLRQAHEHSKEGLKLRKNVMVSKEETDSNIQHLIIASMKQVAKILALSRKSDEALNQYESLLYTVKGFGAEYMNEIKCAIIKISQMVLERQSSKVKYYLENNLRKHEQVGGFDLEKGQFLVIKKMMEHTPSQYIERLLNKAFYDGVENTSPNSQRSSSSTSSTKNGGDSIGTNAQLAALLSISR